jgi:hypothetical protein
MAGPVLTIGGRQLTFGADGGVTDITSDNTGAPLGTWSTQQDNLVHYTLGGANQTPLAATWSFDANNVLSAVFKTADGSVTAPPFAFQGGIEIDDATHLVYFIVDNTGAKTGFKITLTGSIGLTADSGSLSVALAGGGKLTITGADDQQVLTATENTIADFNAQDLLQFAAVTENPVPGQPGMALPVPAAITFAGTWDIRKEGLVFISQVRVPAGGAPTIDLAFAGTLKGVTAGFAYFTGPDAGDDTQMAFRISGQHTFNSGTLNWSSAIGFSGKAFTAAVEVSCQENIGNNTLKFSGKLNLKDTAGGPLSLQLELSAEYDIDKNGILKFTACVDDSSPTPSYDFKLTGSYKYTNLTLTFSIDYSDHTGAEALCVNIGVQGNRNSIVQNLSLVLNITPAAAQFRLSLTFSVKLTFVDGVRVNQPAQKQPAVQGAGGNQGQLTEA